ncbi:MAG: hypothetical protein H7Y31_18055 [Chitinophagaceae bacterium]|nr:hypothetical protein [Chitinophagaceae bacterium]
MKNAKLKLISQLLYYPGLAFLIARILMGWAEKPELVFIFGWIAIILLLAAILIRLVDFILLRAFRKKQKAAGIEE